MTEIRDLINLYGVDPLWQPIAGVAKSFNRKSAQSVAPGATVVLASLRLGDKEWLRISHMGQRVSAVAAWANLKWSLLICGMPLSDDYHEILVQFGTINDPTPVYIVIMSAGALVEWVAENTHATDTYTVTGRIQGWAMPFS